MTPEFNMAWPPSLEDVPEGDVCVVLLEDGKTSTAHRYEKDKFHISEIAHGLSDAEPIGWRKMPPFVGMTA